MKLLVIRSMMFGSGLRTVIARRRWKLGILADSDGKRAREVAARVNRITGAERRCGPPFWTPPMKEPRRN